MLSRTLRSLHPRTEHCRCSVCFVVGIHLLPPRHQLWLHPLDDVDSGFGNIFLLADVSGQIEQLQFAALLFAKTFGILACEFSPI